jgi:AcrR family transcriptional regulator
VRLIAARGWQATTLRDVAREAGVSVGLLYRYFPSKRAVVLALYDELSAAYAARAATMRPGRWRDRFVYALRTSLEVLDPHRATLAALVPVLVGDPDDGLFAPRTAFSRLRVQAVFVQAVAGATDPPRGALGPALGRLLYLVHLAVLLWWLLDRSPEQRATRALLTVVERGLRLAAPALRVPGVSGLLVAADALVREGLLGEMPGQAG